MTVSSAFSTQITAQAGAAGQNGMTSGKAAGSSLSGGLAFFDLILTNAEKAIDQQLQTLQTAQTAQTAAPSDALQISAQIAPDADALSLVSEQANINIIEALANSAYTTDKLGKSGDGDTDITAALALNPQSDGDSTQLLQILKNGGDAELSTENLQNAIISGDADLKPALNNLQRILQKLQVLAQKDSSSLIGTNITPEQITDLQKKVDDLLNGVTEDGKNEAEEFAGIFAGLIHILPPQAKPDAVIRGAGSVTITPSGDVTPQEGKSAPELPAGTKPSDDLAAKLNNLIGGSTTDDATGTDNGQKMTGLPPHAAHMAAHTQAPASHISDQTLAQQASQNTQQNSSSLAENSADADSQGLPENDGDGLPKTESAFKTDKLSPRDAAMAAAQHAKGQNGASSSDMSALKAALPFLFGDNSSYTADYYTTTASGNTNAYAAVTGNISAMTQGMSASNVLTQAPQAAFMHPGTQMVAANLQKMGNSGQNSRITLQLDPPELGRVEIKMSFEKNSKIKAVLTVEKPETHAMLQKDSGVLERILQGAGLQTDDGSLSFELAGEGYAFGRDGQQDGGQGRSSRRAGNESSDEIIQATMNWAVDPETGHMHYNIVA